MLKDEKDKLLSCLISVNKINLIWVESSYFDTWTDEWIVCSDVSNFDQRRTFPCLRIAKFLKNEMKSYWTFIAELNWQPTYVFNFVS